MLKQELEKQFNLEASNNKAAMTSAEFQSRCLVWATMSLAVMVIEDVAAHYANANGLLCALERPCLDEGRARLEITVSCARAVVQQTATDMDTWGRHEAS